MFKRIMDHVQQLDDSFKHALDLMSFGSAIAAALSFIPHLAAVLGVVWICLRIYETRLNIQLAQKKLNEQ